MTKDEHGGIRWCDILDDEQPEIPCGKDGICKLDGRKVGVCVACDWCLCGTAFIQTKYGLVHKVCMETIGTHGLAQGLKIVPQQKWKVLTPEEVEAKAQADYDAQCAQAQSQAQAEAEAQAQAQTDAERQREAEADMDAQAQAEQEHRDEGEHDG